MRNSLFILSRDVAALRVGGLGALVVIRNPTDVKSVEHRSSTVPTELPCIT